MSAYFAIDTETTGFRDNYLLELACVKIDNTLNHTFRETICPVKPIEVAATNVHGMTMTSVAFSRDEKSVLQTFLAFVAKHSCDQGLDQVVFVAHNANYDRKVLLEALNRHSLHFPFDVSWECTLQMSRALDPNKLYKHTLKDCCGRANIAYVNGHSALPDAIMCAELFQSFFESQADKQYEEGLQSVREQECMEQEEMYQIWRESKERDACAREKQTVAPFA
jgi:DNA polymerase III epsilon subunit-like protein